MTRAAPTEIAAIREAIKHTELGPLYDLGCRENLVQLRRALTEHESAGCPERPGECLAAWVAEQINTHCRENLAAGGTS